MGTAIFYFNKQKYKKTRLKKLVYVSLNALLLLLFLLRIIEQNLYNYHHRKLIIKKTSTPQTNQSKSKQNYYFKQWFLFFSVSLPSRLFMQLLISFNVVHGFQCSSYNHLHVGSKEVNVKKFSLIKVIAILNERNIYKKHKNTATSMKHNFSYCKILMLPTLFLLDTYGGRGTSEKYGHEGVACKNIYIFP